HEFVVMPDHFHLILTPAPEVSLEKALQYIKGGFSFHAKKELQITSLSWEESFTNHRIRDPEDYEPVSVGQRKNSRAPRRDDTLATPLVPHFIQNLINLVQFSQFAASVPGQRIEHGWQDEDIHCKQRPLRRMGV